MNNSKIMGIKFHLYRHLQAEICDKNFKLLFEWKTVTIVGEFKNSLDRHKLNFWAY